MQHPLSAKGGTNFAKKLSSLTFLLLKALEGGGARGSVVCMALCYTSEGRGFETRRDECFFFSNYLILQPYRPPRPVTGIALRFTFLACSTRVYTRNFVVTPDSFYLLLMHMYITGTSGIGFQVVV
jgi:hypothetical protein